MKLPSLEFEPSSGRSRFLIPSLALLLILGLGLVQTTPAVEPDPAGNILHPAHTQEYYQDVRLNTNYFKGYFYDAGSIVMAPMS